MNILYFDCPTGISGDMCLGAFIDLGVDIEKIKKELKKLPVKGYTITTRKERRHGITGTRFRVKTDKTRRPRTFKDIKGLIEKSKLSQEVKRLSIEIFKNLAKAEGKIHGISPQKVHFHEVGAVDSIVDIVGTAIAVTSLNVDTFYSSAIPLGSGWVNTEHGRLPIPAPATLELARGMPVLPSPIETELTTPTGAAIIKTLAADFGDIPHMKVEKTGYGIGGKDFKEAPNLLRVILGKGEGGRERLLQMETNIDDMNPQIAGYLMEKLFEAGAIEVFFTPVQMKKSRPGLLLTILAEERDRTKLLDIVFSESTTIGVRCYPVERRCLERKVVKVKTRYGTVRVKVCLKDGKPINQQPEYEDCRAIAEKRKVPLKTVMDTVRVQLNENKN
jgi:uncharacterized protein (TIGR00299 family) protein